MIPFGAIVWVSSDFSRSGEYIIKMSIIVGEAIVWYKMGKEQLEGPIGF